MPHFAVGDKITCPDHGTGTVIRIGVLGMKLTENYVVEFDSGVTRLFAGESQCHHLQPAA
jgi:RNA polymerase-interacting CarD/CdnL/TRCF family regulator